MQVVIWVVFLVILYCLGSGAFYLVRRDAGVSLVKVLTWRVVLSLFMFALLIAAYHFGWIVRVR